MTVTAAPAFVSFRLISQGMASGSSGSRGDHNMDGAEAASQVEPLWLFSGAGAALSGGSPAVNIPTSAVLGQVPTGSPSEYTPFTQSNPVGGASLLFI